MVEPYVEALRYLTPLGFDVLTFAIIDRLASSGGHSKNIHPGFRVLIMSACPQAAIAFGVSWKCHSGHAAQTCAQLHVSSAMYGTPFALLLQCISWLFSSTFGARVATDECSHTTSKRREPEPLQRQQRRPAQDWRFSWRIVIDSNVHRCGRRPGEAEAGRGQHRGLADGAGAVHRTRRQGVQLQLPQLME